MSKLKAGQVQTPPSVFQQALSVFLLVLFAPIVFAVGSSSFRPSWLLNRVAGVPLSVILVTASIILFVGLTWIFSQMVFDQTDEGEGE